MTQTNIIYNCQQVTFDYQMGQQSVRALHELDLKIERGDFLVFCGPSGSGKSTLLNLLGLIEPPQAGEIHFQGKSLKHLSEPEKNDIRRHHLGFIFQSFHLINVLSAYENVEYFLIRQGIEKQEREKRVTEALTRVGLSEHMMKKPLEMSGGQRQRVAIARALAKKPQVIIADEPTASLDQKNGHEVINILKELSIQEGTTILIASHDPMVIESATHVIRLQDGSLV